jgi:hypothetical protein
MGENNGTNNLGHDCFSILLRNTLVLQEGENMEQGKNLNGLWKMLKDIMNHFYMLMRLVDTISGLITL